MTFINASSMVTCAAGCDGFVFLFGAAALVPGLLARLVNKLAFFPPVPAGYHVGQDKKVALVTADCEVVAIPDLTNNGITVDTVRMWTRRQSIIHGFHFRRHHNCGTILFSHGNSTDIGHMFYHLAELSYVLRMNVFAYDYTGYGESSGTPSEADLSSDIDAAYHYLHHDCQIPQGSIFVMGQSIGSVPSIDLATREDVGGVILHSPLKSGLSVLVDVKTKYWFDVFQNVERIEDVRAPVLIMHGTHDTEVPFHHAVELLEACPKEFAFEPWWVTEGGHNDIELSHRKEYFERLSHFIDTVCRRRPKSDLW